MTAPARALPPLILSVLALVSAVEPLSINMYLSGLPQLGRDLEIGAAGAQLTLTFFLAGMAIGQLLTGPLSDASGRRGLFRTGVFVLALGSALSALAPVAWVLFASPFVLQVHHGFTPVQYSLIFAMNTTGMFVVSLINARVVRRAGPNDGRPQPLVPRRRALRRGGIDGPELRE